MPIYVEAIGKSLGSCLIDVHGRTFGKLVGLSTNIKDEVTEVKVDLGNGELQTYPIEQIEIKEGTPILLPTWKIQATEITREYEIVQRRLNAINLLLGDGDIDRTSYDEMKTSLENAREDITSIRGKLVDELERRLSRLEYTQKDLQLALTNNKMLYSSGEISELSYRSANQPIREALERTQIEAKDISDTTEQLRGLEARIEEKTKRQGIVEPAPKPVSKPEIPDVVVVKVRQPSIA